MQRRGFKIVLIATVAFLLSGCGAKEEEEPVIHEVVLHEQADTAIWDGKEVQSITPCCAFESTDDKLTIYPYYNSDEKVTVEKLMLSKDNEFWKSITSVISTDNIITAKGYSLATLSNGNSIGYIPIDDENCYWIFSSELPSGYVQAVAKTLCQ